MQIQTDFRAETVSKDHSAVEHWSLFHTVARRFHTGALANAKDWG